MKLINTGQLMVALKIVVLILITGLTLPFYGGNTTSALNHIAFVHDCGEANKLPSESGSQTPPPARVDYNKSDVGTIAPVQVIPLPPISRIPVLHLLLKALQLIFQCPLQA